MTYIIDPMWFYWISVVDAVKFGSLILGVVLLIMLGVESFEVYPPKIVTSKRMWAFIGACFLVAVFVPSKTTLTQMLLAKFATYENAELAIDGIQSAADYIINALKEVG